MEMSKNLLSRDFRHRSIFDFCNNICQKRKLRTHYMASMQAFARALPMPSSEQ